MARVCQHITAEDGSCTHCGTSPVMIAKGFTCIWRDTPDARSAEMAPEPKRRQFACEAFYEIKIRADEVAKERLPLDGAP